MTIVVIIKLLLSNKRGCSIKYAMMCYIKECKECGGRGLQLCLCQDPSYSCLAWPGLVGPVAHPS